MNNIHITRVEVYYFNVYVVTIFKSKTVKFILYYYGNTVICAAVNQHPVYRLRVFEPKITHTRSFYSRILFSPIMHYYYYFILKYNLYTYIIVILLCYSSSSILCLWAFTVFARSGIGILYIIDMLIDFRRHVGPRGCDVALSFTVYTDAVLSSILILYKWNINVPTCNGLLRNLMIKGIENRRLQHMFILYTTSFCESRGNRVKSSKLKPRAYIIIILYKP